MWQRVAPDDTALVERAYALLSPCDEVTRAASPQELLSRQEIYVLDAGKCELAAGFEYSATERVWRIKTAGVRGGFSLELAAETVDFLTTFARDKGVRSLYASTVRRDPLHATEVIYRALHGVASKHPEVASVRSRAIGATMLWEIAFK